MKYLFGAFGILLIFLCVPCGATELSDYSGNTTFTYNLSGTSSSQTDYQVRFILSNSSGAPGYYAPYNIIYTNGTTRPDWYDINITSGDGTPLNFWVENNTQTGYNATVWARIPSITNGNTTTGRWYYGNSTQSISNMDGLNTFIFFDDFTISTLNSTSWGTYGTPSATITGGAVTIGSADSNADQLYTKYNFIGVNSTIRARIKTAHYNTASYSESFGYRLYPITNVNWTTAFFAYSPRTNTFGNRLGSAETNTTMPPGWAAGTYSVINLNRKTDRASWSIDNNLTPTEVSTNYPFMDNGNISFFVDKAGASISSDWVFIAKSLDVPPTTSEYITSLNTGAPTASFSCSPTEVYIDNPVACSDSSTQSPLSWNWSFGDGTYSEEQNPTHNYSSNGYFTISLNATNAAGYDIETKTNYITVGSVGGLKSYTYSSQHGYGDGMSFITQLPNESYLVIWANGTYTTWHNTYTQISTDFGNTWSSPKLFVSNSTYGIHRYYPFRFNTTRTCAVYTILDVTTETVGDSFYRCTDDNAQTWTDPVQWNSGSYGGYKSYMFFITSPPSRLSNQRIVIPVQWWNTTSSMYNMRVYASEDNLTTISLAGSVLPLTSASAINEGNIVQLKNQTLYMGMRNYTHGLYEMYSLSTDNGTTWSTPQNSFVVSDDSQIVLSKTQWGDAFMVWNNVSSSSIVRHPITAGVSIDNMSSQYIWSDINSTPTKLCYPSVAFNRSGEALVTYWDQTNEDWYFVSVDPTKYMLQNLTPVSNFISDVHYNVSSGDTVAFSDTSLYAPTSWNWSFGDGTYSEEQNPSHIYSSLGGHTVSLTTTNLNGESAITKDYYLLVEEGDNTLFASFTSSQNPSNINDVVTFTDTSTGFPTTWNWTIDGSITNTTQNIAYAFTTLGDHTVDLNVTNSTGSFSNITKTQTVVNASGFTQQDLWQTPHFTVTLNIKDSTNAPIPVVTVTDSNGQSYTTTNGTAYFTEDAGAVVFYFAATGYTSKAMSYVVDEDATHTVQLATSSSSAPVYNVYPPKDVKFHITSFFGAPIPGASVTIQGITTSTGNWDWLVTLLGINLDEVAINGTAMTETTDSNGDAVFLMLPSVKYNITTTASGYTFPQSIIAPQATEYTLIANWNESWFASGNDTLKDVNVSVSWVKFNETHSFVNITYEDRTATTTGGTITVYRDTTGRLANATPIKTMDITGTTCSNSTLVDTPTGGSSYRVQVNATTTDQNILRTFTHYFKGSTVMLPGFTSETILWLALFIVIFTAAFAGATHSPQMAVVLCVESWVFWAIGWLDGLIGWFGYGELSIIGVLTLASFITVLWNITEGKAKGKRSS